MRQCRCIAAVLGVLLSVGIAGQLSGKSDQPAVRVLTGHKDDVYSVAFSPDGKTLVSGSGDRTVKLWDVETGKLKQTLTGHSDKVRAVAFSSGGMMLASGSEDKTVKLWDAQTSECKRTLRGHSDIVFSVAFSPEENVLASGSRDRTAKLWDIVTGREIQTLKEHRGFVHSVAFSPDGKTFACGSGRKTPLQFRAGEVKVWDAQTGALLRSLQSIDYVFSVAFAPHGRVLVIGSGSKEYIDESTRESGETVWWSMQTGKVFEALKENIGYVYSVAFSPDGNTLAVGCRSRVRLWDVTKIELIQTLRGHRGGVLSVAFSPDGRILASGGADSTVRLWNLGILKSQEGK